MTRLILGLALAIALSTGVFAQFAQPYIDTGDVLRDYNRALENDLREMESRRRDYDTRMLIGAEQQRRQFEEGRIQSELRHMEYENSLPRR